ncbi:hypothetical protein E2562_038710 [Oryza meyeriana var. granulata]|uniref:Uncharacterized protein n=1 Tax=Oryza meyeriana var. granulata TaxID=110450 RepID=A0A6G1CWR7_9ORYZ|nr:hypothetical protein E2562_038710 [Oryza meyeriana var. granulata]
MASPARSCDAFSVPRLVPVLGDDGAVGVHLHCRPHRSPPPPIAAWRRSVRRRGGEEGCDEAVKSRSGGPSTAGLLIHPDPHRPRLSHYSHPPTSTMALATRAVNGEIGGLYLCCRPVQVPSLDGWRSEERGGGNDDLFL